MFTLKNISKTFKGDFWKKGVEALNQVNFQMKPGKITGFLGANGAGKTTVIKIMMGLIRPDEGTITYDPHLGQNPKEILSNIGFLPERVTLYPYLTGRNLLNYLGGINNLKRSKLKENINYWAERFDIDKALDRKIRGYSKGMVQRLGLVSCLIHDPLLLILDEPLSGMDPHGRRGIKKIFKELNDSGKSIFFSSHITSDIEAICDELIIIEKGKVVKEGSLDKILGEESSNTYYMKILGEASKILNKNIISSKESGPLTVFELSEIHIKEVLDEVIGKKLQFISLKKKRASLEDIVFESDK